GRATTLLPVRRGDGILNPHFWTVSTRSSSIDPRSVDGERRRFSRGLRVLLLDGPVLLSVETEGRGSRDRDRPWFSFGPGYSDAETPQPARFYWFSLNKVFGVDHGIVRNDLGGSSGVSSLHEGTRFPCDSREADRSNATASDIDGSAEAGPSRDP